MLNKIVIVLTLLLSIACVAQEKSQVLSQSDFKKEISKKNIQLVDVRTLDEYNSGHIDHAKNIDFMKPNFKNEINKLDKTKAVYVYCQAGGRSAKAASLFVEAGFKEVYDLKDGYGAWKK